jgi:abortive infection bacteriophage resistance protein
LSNQVKQYNKTPCSTVDLLARLKSKNLHVPDDNKALRALNTIGYYRLLIYMRPLQDAQKNFILGTGFDQILNLYSFDRHLRLLCLNATEKIEVALRAAIINKLTVAHGAHFYTESRHYSKIDGFKEFMGAAQKAKYLAISHYYKNYNTPSMPPIWAVVEAITFGTLSCFYSNLHTKNQKLVAAEFGYNYETLESWFRSLNIIRNMCAHHNRLWNSAIFVNQPSSKKELKNEIQNSTTFYARAVVIWGMLKKIDPNSAWHTELKSLINTHQINAQSMGFPPGWDTRPFWN